MMNKTELEVKKAELESNFPPSSESKRYKQLRAVLVKALQVSRQHFNVPNALAKIYGDEVDRLVKLHGRDALVGFFNQAFDQAEQEILADMDDFCAEQGIKQTLLVVDAIAEKLDRESIWQEMLETYHQKTAKDLVARHKSQALTVPNGWTPNDVIGQVKVKMLQEQVKAWEAKAARLKAQAQQYEKEYNERRDSAQENEEKTANLVNVMGSLAGDASQITK